MFTITTFKEPLMQTAKNTAQSAMLALMCCAGLAAAPAFAAPSSVLLHPGGALIHEEFTLKPEQDGRTLRLLLPADADPQSVDVTAGDHAVSSLSFRDALAPDTEPELSLKRELGEVRGRIHALERVGEDAEAYRSFWRQPPVTLTSPAELSALAELMARKLAAFDDGNEARTAKLQALKEREKLLEQRLTETGGADFAREAVLTLDKSVSGPVKVHCVYNCANAGWRPMYRLEARPDDGVVELRLDAEIWQRSGRNWKNVELQLATMNPRQNMTPPALAAWIAMPRPVSPAPVVRSASTNMLMDSAPMAQEAAGSASFAKSSAPRYRDGASYEAWSLGVHDVNAGVILRLPLQREEFKAAFSYVARPSRTRDAYLAARLDLPVMKHFPAGDALFLVDGVLAGSSTFSLDTSDGGFADNSIYFGRDPLVTTEMKSAGQQSGREGFIDRKRTYTWDWEMTVANRHKRPVNVRVEEPAPQSRDKEIVLEIQSKPEAKREDNTLFWEVDVPAGKSISISHKVLLSAPANMQVWEGR